MVRLIGREGGPKVLEEGDPKTKMKKIYEPTKILL